jgi:hypothetical protein
MRRFPLGLLSCFSLFNTAIYLFLQPGYLIPDGVGYLAYLPTIFDAHTLSFIPFFTTNPMGLPFASTSTGWVANLWPFGLSFLSLPFYEATRLAMRGLGHSQSPAWGPLYLGITNLASILFGGAAVIFLYDLYPMSIRQGHRLGLALICFFGTPLFFYTFCVEAVAHAASAFASGLLIWYWLKTLGRVESAQEEQRRWFTLGLLGGIAAMVRTQEAVILIAPLWEWTRALRRDPNRSQAVALSCLICGVGIGFLPQALLWNALYGHFLYSPQVFNLSLDYFALGKSLLSSYHGLLAWTPLYGVALVGLVRARLKGNWEAGPLLAIVGIQIAANSVYTAWWDMLSFSLRLLTGTFLIAGLGIGWLRPTRTWHWGILIFCALWSMALALHGYAGSINLRVFYPWPQLLTKMGSWRSFYTGWNQELWRYGKIPVIMISFGIFFELTVIAWVWRLRQLAPIRSAPLGRLLRWTFIPWILYASVCILRAGQAPKPPIPPHTVLTAEDLGHIFVADSYYGKALYWLERREPALSLQAIDQAERQLPLSPYTQNFRVEYDRLRGRLSISPDR